MKQNADGDTLAPLLHQARVLSSNEFIPTDFQRQQTISEIVQEVGGQQTSLNDMPANVLDLYQSPKERHFVETIF